MSKKITSLYNKTNNLCIECIFLFTMQYEFEEDGHTVFVKLLAAVSDKEIDPPTLHDETVLVLATSVVSLLQLSVWQQVNVMPFRVPGMQIEVQPRKE